MKTHSFRSEVEYLSNENLFLQDENDQLLDDNTELLDKIQNIGHLEAELRHKIRNAKKIAAIEVRQDNQRIADKAVYLSNLVDEYQVVLDKYVQLTNTKLATNKLKQLREQGGYL